MQPIGYLQAGALLVGNGLLLATGTSPGRPGLGVLLGLGLVLWAGRVLVRGQRPQLLTIGPEALYLAPLGAGPGQLPEPILLSSIMAYTYWLRLLRYQAFAQYHLRLELADGRVLHLADRPGTPRPTDPAGTVRLDVLAQRLARRAKSGLLRRQQLFYLGLKAIKILGRFLRLFVR